MSEFVDKGDVVSEGIEQMPSLTEEELVPEKDISLADGVLSDKTSADIATANNLAGQQSAAENRDEDAVGTATNLQALVDERTQDLQRLSAEYTNYKKRVDRDRDLARQMGVEAVLRDLMIVLDSLALAQEHEELSEGFKLIADEISKIATKYSLESFGQVGEPFDPSWHEALMQLPMNEPVEVATISQVMQLGYRIKDRIIRPARVAVAQPE